MEWRKLLHKAEQPAAPVAAPRKKSLASNLKVALMKARQTPAKHRYALQAPELAKGVMPPKLQAPVAIAMDSFHDNFPAFNMYFNAEVAGFPGYPYLAMLATRAEYRAMASTLATELTREWITITSTETAGDATKQKCTELMKALDDLGLQQVIRKAAEHDAYYGRGQIFIDIIGQDRSKPLIISDKTIPKVGVEKVTSKIRVQAVEAMWTTPSGYNSIDPGAPDFYRPPSWFMLGKQVSADRLLTVVTRPLPDMLKPAFNFGGMSLSQLAEDYVENWLRTRQAVADLIDNYSTTAIKTNMGSTLNDEDDGSSLMDRVELFTATRSNKGLMTLDMDTEDLVQVNTPLGGLHELQAQALELLCVVSREPSVILTGIEPSGLNASSEGSIKVFFDWIAAVQEAFWWAPIDTVIKILQLMMYGSIDPDITWSFVSLFQMTPKESSEIRAADATAAAAYVAAGAIDGEDIREKIARDPDSGWQGLELNKEIAPLPGADNDDDEGDDDKQDK